MRRKPTSRMRRPSSRPRKRVSNSAWRRCPTYSRPAALRPRRTTICRRRIGASEIAHGDLATALGISPTIPLQVESIQALTIPQDLTVTVEASIDKALAQRPDLMQRVAELRAAACRSESSQDGVLADSESSSGTAGLAKNYGAQDQSPGCLLRQSGVLECAPEPDLDICLTDSHARTGSPAPGPSKSRPPPKWMRCAIRWKTKSGRRTPLRALRFVSRRRPPRCWSAASSSYNAALQSYTYGVRSQIDVVSAQRALAAARTADVTARTQLLTGIAALAFQTGDLLHAKGP